MIYSTVLHSTVVGRYKNVNRVDIRILSTVHVSDGPKLHMCRPYRCIRRQYLADVGCRMKCEHCNRPYTFPDIIDKMPFIHRPICLLPAWAVASPLHTRSPFATPIPCISPSYHPSSSVSSSRRFSMSTSTPYSLCRHHALLSVLSASRLSRSLRSTLPDVLSKSDHSPVTVADYAIQALIVSRLHKLFPLDHFIAEETSTSLRASSTLLDAVSQAADLPSEEVLSIIDLCAHPGGDGTRTWILDPIDGTRGFISGRQYCIALGLVEHGIAQLGVLGCPQLPSPDGETGVLFHAERGAGTFQVGEKSLVGMNEGDTPGVKCSVSDVQEMERVRFSESVERGHSDHELSGRVAQILGVTMPPVRMDSMAKYGCMARGEFSVFLRFPREGYVENVWDSAPAAIVVEEAGGKVTDGKGNELNFGNGRCLDNEDGIIATNGVLHDKVVQAVQKAYSEQREGVKMGEIGK